MRRARRREGADVAARHAAKADVHDVFNAGAPHQHDQVMQIVEAVTSDAEQQGGPSVKASAPTPVARSGGEVRVLAKPPVRKLAKDLGVDLTTLTPSGPNGTVTRADVEGAARMPQQYAGNPRDVAAAAVPGRLREWREPIKGVRKMMGQAMVQSAFSAPHVTEWITVDVTRTTEFVQRLRARREFAEVKVSPLLVLARACVLAIRRTPVVNTHLGRAGPGDRLQELREPRHCRSDAARTGRPERQGRRHPVVARARPGAR